MKYFFGIDNNFAEVDKYNRVNLQCQFLLKNGYEFHNGKIIKPEKKEFYVQGMQYPVFGVANIPDIPITIEKTGWYCPSDVIASLPVSNHFVHMGQIKTKVLVDWTGLVTTMRYDSPKEDVDGNSCYTIQPKHFNEYIKTNIYSEGIGAVKIKKLIYNNHNFLLSNFHAMHSLENFYRLYIFERSENV